MSDTITRIDDGTGQSSLCDLLRSPRGSQRKNSLNGNVETRHVEGLEHNLSSVLSVLRSVERRLGLHDTRGRMSVRIINTNKKELMANKC